MGTDGNVRWLAFAIAVQAPSLITATRAPIVDPIDVIGVGTGARLHVTLRADALFPSGIPYVIQSDPSGGGVFIHVPPDASGGAFVSRSHVSDQVTGGCAGWVARDAGVGTYTLTLENQDAIQTLTLDAALTNAAVGTGASMGDHCILAACAPYAIFRGSQPALNQCSGTTVAAVNAALTDCLTAMLQSHLLLDQVLDDALRLHGPMFNPTESVVHAAQLTQSILVYVDVLGLAVAVSTSTAKPPQNVKIMRLPVSISVLA